MTRPEYQLPPNLYYNYDEANKYTNCTRIIDIQTQLSERALELLALSEEEQHLVLDIGCGSGISGHTLTESGIQWVGLDISRDMLDVAVQRQVQGELIECDIGQGFKFRPGVFDAAISVSAIQWLCVSYTKKQAPFRRLSLFFTSLKNSLRHGARAVLQFYPDGNEQLNMITNAALKSGFSGSVVVDYPHSTKAKKLYLVLTLGGSEQTTMNVIQGITNEIEDEEQEKQAGFVTQMKKKIQKEKTTDNKFKSKEWIMKKKTQQRKHVINQLLNFRVMKLSLKPNTVVENEVIKDINIHINRQFLIRYLLPQMKILCMINVYILGFIIYQYLYILQYRSKPSLS